jgi:hypothetical protein
MQKMVGSCPVGRADWMGDKRQWQQACEIARAELPCERGIF